MRPGLVLGIDAQGNSIKMSFLVSMCLLPAILSPRPLIVFYPFTFPFSFFYSPSDYLFVLSPPSFDVFIPLAPTLSLLLSLSLFLCLHSSFSIFVPTMLIPISLLILRFLSLVFSSSPSLLLYSSCAPSLSVSLILSIYIGIEVSVLLGSPFYMIEPFQGVDQV